MPIINRIADFHADLTAWRRELHRHPETAFEEEWTSAFVAEKLESFGLEVHRGIAKTGLVAVRRGQRENGRAIGLRADRAALDTTEAKGLRTEEHKSELQVLMRHSYAVLYLK